MTHVKVMCQSVDAVRVGGTGRCALDVCHQTIFFELWELCNPYASYVRRQFRVGLRGRAAASRKFLLKKNSKLDQFVSLIKLYLFFD